MHLGFLVVHAPLYAYDEHSTSSFELGCTLIAISIPVFISKVEKVVSVESI